MALYPTQPDTSESLFNQTNNARSDLINVINVSDVPPFLVTVTDGSAFPTDNFLITMQAEIMFCSSRTANDITVAARGQEGTIAVNHPSGTFVSHSYTANSRQIMKEAQIDQQNYQFNFRGKVINSTTADPGPLTPVQYDQYRVAAGAIGVWAGQDDNLAFWDGFGWQFYVPSTGDFLFDQDSLDFIYYNGTDWIVYSLDNIDLSLGTGPRHLLTRNDADTAWVSKLPEFWDSELLIEYNLDNTATGQFTLNEVTSGTNTFATWSDHDVRMGAIISDWAPGLSYNVGDFVLNANKTYRATTKHISGADFDPDIAANWQIVSGVLRGDWVSAENYLAGDVVRFDNRYWYANVPILAGSTNPIVNADWIQQTVPPNTRDSELFIVDDADETARAFYSANNIVPGNDRVMTLADHDMDLGRLVTEYEAGAGYEAGDLIITGDNIYRANIQLKPAPPVFDPGQWTQITNLGGGGPGGGVRTVEVNTNYTILQADYDAQLTNIICNHGGTNITVTFGPGVALQGQAITIGSVGTGNVLVQMANGWTLNGVVNGSTNIQTQFDVKRFFQAAVTNDQWVFDDSLVRYDSQGNVTADNFIAFDSDPKVTIRDNLRTVAENQLQGALEFRDVNNTRWAIWGQLSSGNQDIALWSEAPGGDFQIRNTQNGQNLSLQANNGDVELQGATSTVNAATVNINGTTLTSVNTNVFRQFSASPTFTIRDSNNTAAQNAYTSAIEFRDSANTRAMFMGRSSSSNTNFLLRSENMGASTSTSFEIEASGGPVLRARTSRQTRQMLPVASVSFIPRTSFGSCTRNAANNVNAVTRFARGIYHIEMASNTIGDVNIASFGQIFVGAPKSVNERGLTWTVIGWQSTNPPRVDVECRNATGNTVDPSGGSNNYTSVDIYGT